MISPMVPMPADDGGRLCILSMVRYLKGGGHEIHFVAPRTRANDAAAFAREVSLHLIDLDPRSTIPGRLWHAFGPLPYAAQKFFSERALNEIRDIAKKHRFDAIHVEHLYVMRFASALKRELRLPLVLHEHNIETMILRHFARNTRNPLVRLYARAECRKMHAFETAALRDCDLVFPVTAEDGGKLRQMAPALNVVVLPHGVDTQRLRFSHCTVPERLLFLTNLDWLPNRESFDYYTRDIHPALKSAVPGLRTLVVGKDLHRADRRNLPPDIEFRGFLPDLNEASSLASVALVPLRIGSGIRVKILELMAMGITVVSTRLGAQGIHVRDGEHLLIADSPEEITRAVKGLLADPDRCRRIAVSARRFIEENHSTEAFGSIVNDAYGSLLAARRPG